MPKAAPFSGRHRSASKDARFANGIAALRMLPSLKRIGLGYLRSASHGKPLGSIRLAQEITGGFKLYHYASGAFIELQLYTDDPDRLYEEILGLRGRFIVQDRLGAPDPAVAETVPQEQPPEPDPSPEPPPEVEAVAQDPLAAVVEELRAEQAATLALVAAMERRLHALEDQFGRRGHRDTATARRAEIERLLDNPATADLTDREMARRVGCVPTTIGNARRRRQRGAAALPLFERDAGMVAGPVLESVGWSGIVRLFLSRNRADPVLRSGSGED